LVLECYKTKMNNILTHYYLSSIEKCPCGHDGRRSCQF
jgi:hypothetical protein